MSHAQIVLPNVPMRLQYTGRPTPNVVRDDRYMKHRASYHEFEMTRLLRNS